MPAAEAWTGAAEEAKMALRAGFAELVRHMADRLADPKKIFRDSMVENFREFLGTFDFRNICDDAELQTLVRKARGMLGGSDAETLREATFYRNEVGTAMTKIAAQLDTMLADRPARRIRNLQAD